MREVIEIGDYREKRLELAKHFTAALLTDGEQWRKDHEVVRDALKFAELLLSKLFTVYEYELERIEINRSL